MPGIVYDVKKAVRERVNKSSEILIGKTKVKEGWFFWKREVEIEVYRGPDDAHWRRLDNGELLGYLYEKGAINVRA